LTVDVLAIGAHPDDVEIGCGGTLAALAEAGRRVGIAHLTSGEAGTRGTPGQRRQEAERAAGALGASTLEWLDCGDGGLRRGVEQEETLIALLRRTRPRLVLAPPRVDRHPDHERAHRLVVDAAYYAGLVKRGEGEAHRPQSLWTYMLHHPFEPQFVVDVTHVWSRKQAALDAYESQLHSSRPPANDSTDPSTLVASADFRSALEGRARHYGLSVGATFGEPFQARRPLRVDAPAVLEGLS
jgi:bacillithiol biosynthesis deacetylase BshB1